MQSKEETKIKVQYKVNTPQHFLPLTSQFRFSMKSREAFGDRHSNMCTDTSTNLPCTALSAKVLHCLHKKIDSVSAFSFSLAKGCVSWPIQIGTPAVSFPVHLFGINWWEGKTFSSENSGISPKSRASFTGLELVKIFKIFELKIKLFR